MKILQVTPRYPPQSGGVETHVAAISERLVNRGHDVTVITADANREGQQREQRNGVTVRRYRSVAPADAMHFCPQIASAVRNATVDVVHAHNYHSFPLFFTALGAGDRRFVVTTHYHGGSASSVRDVLLSLYQPFGRWAVRQADKVIAVSEWEKKQLVSDFDIEATVIPNGLDMERFTNADPIKRERPYLLTVGRLEEYKGIQYIIQAMTELPEYDLLIAGSGPYRSTLERLATAENVENQIDFLGYVDEDRLPQLYTGAEVYVTMSEFEAYAMTVAEALASGTPCVLQSTGALKDWIDTKGVMGVKRPSIENIIEAIKGVDTVETPHFLSWDEVTKKVAHLYE